MSIREKIVSFICAALVLCMIGAVIFFMAVFMMMDFDADAVTTTFVSPSGHVTIIVRENCFGFACSQEAFLDGPSLNRSLGELNVGDPENSVFDTATVRWNADETEMTWSVSTRHGSKSGVISLK